MKQLWPRVTRSLTGDVQVAPIVEKSKEELVKTNGRWEEKYPIAKYKWVQGPNLSVHHLKCCGVKEIHGIQDRNVFLTTRRDRYEYEPDHPADLITKIQKLYKSVENHRPFWIFTDNDAKNKHGSGESLAKYIEDNKLGSIQRSTEELNKNSENKIVVYLWTIPRDFPKHKAE